MKILKTRALKYAFEKYAYSRIIKLEVRKAIIGVNY